jgi:hypothetical protein
MSLILFSMAFLVKKILGWILILETNEKGTGFPAPF